MLRTRREILSVLQSSTNETSVSLVATGPRHSHRITIQSTRRGEAMTFNAVLLVRSSDWYRYRLNVFGKLSGIELIVCAIHDSCVDVHVWCVEDAKEYVAGETAIPLETLRDPKVRGTKYGSFLLTAALLCSKQEAMDILDDANFPTSTRYRYESKVREYANLKRGTKLSVV
jgi:hypothetical protein